MGEAERDTIYLHTSKIRPYSAIFFFCVFFYLEVFEGIKIYREWLCVISEMHEGENKPHSLFVLRWVVLKNLSCLRT